MLFQWLLHPLYMDTYDTNVNSISIIRNGQPGTSFELLVYNDNTTVIIICIHSKVFVGSVV